MMSLLPLHAMRRALVRVADHLGVNVLPQAPIGLVADNAEWAITWVARYICDGVNALRPGLAAVTPYPSGLRRSIVHFGTRDIWLAAQERIGPTNKVVVTSLHGDSSDGEHVKRSLGAFVDSLPRVAAVVTSNRIVERRLLKFGVSRERLHVIPLGVDTRLFVPPTESERASARQLFGIPDGMLCVGSFQKDGVGWGEGLEPKRIKGPDVFVEAVARLARELPVFVLLTGPSRGYVKRRLGKLGIPFVHRMIEDFVSVVRAYHALDVYIIASREEGGPLALVESMATRVPVVTTDVGMVPDIVRHEESAMISSSGDWKALSDHAARILTDSALRQRIVDRAHADVSQYDWMELARRYYKDVYASLLTELGR